MQMFGTIAGSESMIFSFGEDWSVAVAMAEAPHGTAPRLEGKNIANPLAMILAGAALLEHVGDAAGDRAGRAPSRALGRWPTGYARPTCKGHASTTEFTDAVIERTRAILADA